ncbi:helix-hairpin-helix domain-containing protein [Ornithinibacillus californiensis]|uniref:helix-hairpin-helix domain-containing protein n=1 Tax=Ornithinibacillus californiensis TaxID=161536 RepID=UPI00064D85FE|nr:helix-hairpin-helix domain-containing protein [Ornithinibacillus californiensis]
MQEIIKKNIIIGLIIIAAIVIFLIVREDNHEQTATLIPVEADNAIEINSMSDVKVSKILVDIKGEVKQPGVYEMDDNARVQDVVLLAGGFTKEADQNQINLAQKVFDEMIIIVPKMGQEGSQSATQAQTSKIRINYATVEEIQKLPGIGPSKANAIVEYREENGYFKKVEDLLEVSGIGEKTLEALKEEIQVP